MACSNSLYLTCCYGDGSFSIQPCNPVIDGSVGSFVIGLTYVSTGDTTNGDICWSATTTQVGSLVDYTPPGFGTITNGTADCDQCQLDYGGACLVTTGSTNVVLVNCCDPTDTLNATIIGAGVPVIGTVTVYNDTCYSVSSLGGLGGPELLITYDGSAPCLLNFPCCECTEMEIGSSLPIFAVDGNVYVDYTACDGTPTQVTGTSSNLVFNICSLSGQSITTSITVGSTLFTGNTYPFDPLFIGPPNGEVNATFISTCSDDPCGPSPTPSVTPSITPPPVTPSVTPSITPVPVTPSISVTPPVSPSTPCDGVPTPCFSRVFQYSTVSLNTVCVSPFYDQFSFTNLSGTLDVGNVLYLGGCSSCVVAPDGWYIDYTVDLITVFEITGGAGVVTSTTTCPSSAAGTMGYNVFITGTCENPTGAATISPSGGTPPYTVYWSNPLLGYGETKTGLSAGVYQVQLNDSTMPVNNFLNINVSISSGMTVDVTSVSNTTCDLDNGSVTVTALSDYSDITFSLYSGSTVLEFVNTTSFSAVFDNLAPGIYNITAQNEAGCSATTGNFHIYSSDTVDFGFYIINDTQCASPSGKVYITGTTGNGPFTYLWYNGYTGTSITGLTQGTYEVTVTDSLGCSVSKVALVELVPSIGLGSWSAVNPSCFASDGSLTLTITGGTGPYYYSGSNGTTAISYSPSYTFTSLPAGNYFVEVTDAALCKVTFGTTLLTPGTFNVQSISVIDSECSNNGGSIQVNVQQGSPPYTYSLSGVGVNQSGTTISTSYQFTNLTSQTYDLTITDGGSCVYTNSVTVNNNPSYIVTTSGTTSSCGLENGSITLMITSGGTSPYTYSLDNGNTTTTGNLFATFGGLAAGQYLYTIVDSTGCTQTGNVSVLSEGNVEFSLFPTSCGLSGSGGTITALINSGQPPFTFTWSSNVSGNPQNIYVSGLTGGTYSLTIVDDNGCTQTRETTISCSEIISTYMVYEMCSSDFVYTSGTKRGILQMYNEGYRDLTSGHTDCLLSAATFSVQITVSGTTYPSPLVPFYNSTSLLDIPTDQQYFNEVESILLSIPGITGVTIDSTTSEIIISTDGSLSAEEIVIELIIDYDIDCVS